MKNERLFFRIPCFLSVVSSREDDEINKIVFD